MIFHLSALCGSICLLISSLTTTAQAAVTTQFIAKLYTEALGRAPDVTGWNTDVNYFSQNGCSQSTLTTVGEGIFSGPEYASLNYDNVEKVLTLYRSILSRDPDSAGFNAQLAYLNQGNSFSSLVSNFFSGAEFAGEVSKICNGNMVTDPYYARAYGWGSNPALKVPVPTGSSGFQGSAADLQTALNNAPSGGTVYLYPRTLITTTATITIPPGKTLATTGTPNGNYYAHLARIVRNSMFSGPVIELDPGAKLSSVWVSGQRNAVGWQYPGYATIQVDSGNGAEVLHSRTDSPAGWSSLYVKGKAETGVACSNVTINGNLSTGYTSHHTQVGTGANQWADGISDACEGASITYNDIVDPTDAGIVLYRAYPAVQKSQITNNKIIGAGLSAYGALIADPLAPGGSITEDFTGALVSNNLLWTSDATHFDFALALGTMAWAYGNGGVNGTGVNFSNNSTPFTTNVVAGIVIDGMLNATEQNSLTVTLDSSIVSHCTSGYVLTDVLNVHATTGATQVAEHACIGHPGQ